MRVSSFVPSMIFCLASISAVATNVQAATLSQVLATTPEFSKLDNAIKVAGLEADIAALKNATVFAPANRAFDFLRVGQTDALMANPAKLKKLLLNHIVAVPLKESDLVNGGMYKTLAGYSIQGLSERAGGSDKFLYGRIATDCNGDGKISVPELVGSVQITKEDVQVDDNVIVQVLDQVQGRGGDELGIPQDKGFPIEQDQFVGFSCGLLN